MLPGFVVHFQVFLIDLVELGIDFSLGRSVHI
jgi:hypothetical protein